ncbi:MAG: hypothetical protein OEW08_05630 [Gammaproteobacteria bacterium]|nr:hypothetical protein [Gammaproteobacteria bacterium]
MKLKLLLGVTLLGIVIPLMNANARETGEGTGILPATPPINIHTGIGSAHYVGYGALKFDVILPQYAKPGFTLGKDEDSRFKIGEVDFTAEGLVYVNDGNIAPQESSEGAWMLGTLTGAMKTRGFTRYGVGFNTRYSRSGFVLGKRNTFARRILASNGFILDYGFSSLFGLYHISGNTRMESVPATGQLYRYISDFNEDSTGIAYRPMLTLQPTFHLGRWLTMVPFAGVTAFVSADYSSWKVNYWEDVLYGRDCLDGCPDDGFFTHFIPFETFAGFDIELHVSATDTLALSSFFAAANPTNTTNMSEIYLVYTRRFD